MKRAGKAVILLGIVLLALSAGADQFVTSMKIYLQLNPPSYEKAMLQGEEGLKESGAAKNWELHALLAECYASTGRYEEAGKQYQEAIALKPAMKKAIKEGDGKYLSGQNSQWDKAFYTGADLRIKSNLSKVALTDIALTEDMKKYINDNGQPEEVRQGTSQGKPIVVFTYWTKGMDFKFREGKLAGNTKFKDPKVKDYAELAMRDLKGAIALDPEKAEAYEQLAALYDKQGRRSDMIAMLQEALKANPNNAIVHVSLGTVYEKDNKFAEALQEFKQGATLDSTLFAAWAGQGECNQSLHKYAEAIEAFKRSLMIDSTANDVYFNIGLAYFNKEDYANSLKAFKRVVASSPSDGDAWAFVGHNSLNLRDEKAALGAYEKAVDPACNLSPEYAYAVWVDLCKLYTRQNMNAKAKAACAKAQELAPKK